MRAYIERLLFLVFLSVIIGLFSSVLYQRSAADSLTQADLNEDAFRSMECSEVFLKRLRELQRDSGLPISEILTVLYPKMRGNFLMTPDLETGEELLKWKGILLKYNQSGYEQLQEGYCAIWDDLVCLPVERSAEIVYENSWMFERNYGGVRGHEGTDLMPPQNVPGYVPILSMTDGTVENIGWLPKGGYRIGIRSLHGGYFYYAHLASYSRAYQIGDAVKAGEQLGYMGDTGYGPEGTRGKFKVHLHLGIYIRTEQAEEISINPYWILRYLENMAEEGS